MKRISNATQEAVADIMIELIMLLNTICKNTKLTTLNELNNIINNNIKQYNLEEDPFTKLPCSTKEYVKNNLEYERQIMVERYGHHDGI